MITIGETIRHICLPFCSVAGVVLLVAVIMALMGLCLSDFTVLWANSIILASSPDWRRDSECDDIVCGDGDAVGGVKSDDHLPIDHYSSLAQYWFHIAFIKTIYDNILLLGLLADVDLHKLGCFLRASYCPNKWVIVGHGTISLQVTFTSLN